MNFAHLHLHNEYSILDGVGTSQQYAELAKELGQTHLALTNHGGVDGIITHQRACKAAGINPVAGCEMYIVPDHTVKVPKESRNHITLLVENHAGWKNLLKLLTIANTEGFYRRPRVGFEVLKEHLEGLVVLTGCSSGILNAKGGEGHLLDFVDILGKQRVFLEIMPLTIKQQVSLNSRCIELSKEHRLELVATNDCHYPTAEAGKWQEVLLAIQTRKTWNDPTRWKFNVDGLFLKTEDEMRASFISQGTIDKRQIDRALRRSGDIASICEGFSLEQLPVFLPSIKLFKDDLDEEVFLRRIINEGFRTRLVSKGFSRQELSLYTSRIKEELDLIIRLKFTKYFLIVWDLIFWCQGNGIMTGPGRGSVGGSLVAYLMGLTDVDPLEHGLEFFRFISPDRNDLPDIDMDFEDRHRGTVRAYLEEKYGEHHVVGLSTFMTMKGRGVLRDCSRVFEVPLKEVDTAAKSISDTGKGGGNLEEAFQNERECQRFENRWPDVVGAARMLEGQIRGVGQHAAAVCISKETLWEGDCCNIAIRKGEKVANWDMRQAEFMGLMKLDVLGLSTLSVLADCKRMAGFEEDYKLLVPDDPEVYQQILEGRTVGAFQINGSGLTNYCKELGADRFELLSAATALWRPGPLHSGMADTFSRRKRGKEKVPKVSPGFDDITSETFGVIVYQEQVMKVINSLAGIPMKTCNKIRKVMGKSQGSGAFNKYRQEFMDGCLQEGQVSQNKAEIIWETLVTFANYGFNKAHSVEYSLITYWTLWAKRYYPAAFIAASLSFSPKERKNELLKEADRLGIKVMLPKIGLSKATIWESSPEGVVFAPFNCMNGIGDVVAKKIEAADMKPRKQMGFFGVDKRNIKGVNAGTISNLEIVGAFDKEKEFKRSEFRRIKHLFSF